jgi:hypothetical protein
MRKLRCFAERASARECPCSAKSPSGDRSSLRECKAMGGDRFERETGRQLLHEEDGEVVTSPERSRETLPGLLRWGAKSSVSATARAGRVVTK